MMQFVAALALLAVTTWLAKLWIGYIGDAWNAALIGVPIILFIAFLYDRRQARLARTERREMTELD